MLKNSGVALAIVSLALVELSAPPRILTALATGFALMGEASIHREAGDSYVGTEDTDGREVGAHTVSWSSSKEAECVITEEELVREMERRQKDEVGRCVDFDVKPMFEDEVIDKIAWKMKFHQTYYIVCSDFNAVVAKAKFVLRQGPVKCFQSESGRYEQRVADGTTAKDEAIVVSNVVDIVSWMHTGFPCRDILLRQMFPEYAEIASEMRRAVALKYIARGKMDKMKDEQSSEKCLTKAKSASTERRRLKSALIGALAKDEKYSKFFVKCQVGK